MEEEEDGCVLNLKGLMVFSLRGYFYPTDIIIQVSEKSDEMEKILSNKILSFIVEVILFTIVIGWTAKNFREFPYFFLLSSISFSHFYSFLSPLTSVPLNPKM